MAFLPPENVALTNLLAVISDPSATKKRLEELHKTQTDADSKLEEMKAAQAKLDQSQKDLDEKIKKHTDLKLSNEVEYSKLKKELQDKLAAHEADKSVFANDKKAIQDHLDKLNKQASDKNAELNTREFNVSNREKAVSELESKTTILKGSLEAKLTALKSMINS